MSIEWFLKKNSENWKTIIEKSPFKKRKFQFIQNTCGKCYILFRIWKKREFTHIFTKRFGRNLGYFFQYFYKTFIAHRLHCKILGATDSTVVKILKIPVVLF